VTGGNMTDNQDIFVLDKDAALAAILEEECANIDSGPARLPLTAMFVHDNPASRVANWLAIATHHMTVPEGLTVKFYASDDDAGSGGIVAVGDGRQGAVIVGWSDLDSYASEKDGVEFWRRTDAGLISEMLRELLFEANQLVPLARKIWPIERRKADVPLSGLLYDQRRPNTMSDRAAEAIADLMLRGPRSRLRSSG